MTRIYDLGLKYYSKETMREWFKAMYETLLGSAQGPRMGSFIALFGAKETIGLIDAALKQADGINRVALVKSLGTQQAIRVAPREPRDVVIDGGRVIGLGGEGWGAGLWESANIRVQLTGKTVITTGSLPHGQGHETTFAQLASDKLGIPYVWFPADASEEGAQDEVKNIITGDQRPADAQSWEPDTVYAQQTVTVEA